MTKKRKSVMRDSNGSNKSIRLPAEQHAIDYAYDPATLALLLVSHCFRNTIIENYHAEWPEFTDAKMRALMKQAVDSLYNVLCGILSNDAEERAATLEVIERDFPRRWDKPQLDPAFLRAVEFRINLRRLRAEGKDTREYECAYWKKFERRLKRKKQKKTQ